MPKIIIIGSGIAGLAAANYLIPNNIKDVTVLEAKNVTGGRISTKQYGKHCLEMGAQWIHGEDENMVYDLAKRNQLIYEKGDSSCNTEWEDSCEDYFMTESAKRIPPELAESTWFELDRILESANKYFENKTLAHKAKSVGEYANIEFEKYLQKSDQLTDIKVIQRAIFKCRMLLENCDNACQTLEEFPLNMWGCYKEIPGNYFTPLRYGFTKVLDMLLEKIPKDRIVLNSPVKHIYWCEDINKSCKKTGSNNIPETSYSFSSNQATGQSTFPVKVETTKGDIYEADHVIITCSLGVLKESAFTMFQPNLPNVKSSAILKLGFGVVDKIYLEFPEIFWAKDCSAIHLTWIQDEELQNGTQDRITDAYMKNYWWKAFYGFDIVQFHPNILCGWIAGEEARYMESLPDEEIKNTCQSLLAKFTGKAVPEPTNLIRTYWNSDPFIRGSYSYNAMDTTAEDIENLASPVTDVTDAKNPILLFAGEATHCKYFSTVHGAMESGIREAKRLINFYREK